MRVTTESGTVYEFDFSGNQPKVRREADPQVSGMRRDGDWLNIVSLRVDSIKVGEPIKMTLEPLGEYASVTFRETTPVVGIED